HGEIAEASAWLEQLANREPNSLQTLDLRVRLLKAQKQAPLAETFIKKYLQSADADLEAAARLFEDAGQSAAAEETYRKWISLSADRRRLLEFANFLGRQNRVDEALDL